jgi:hypothetical protein
MCIDKNSLDIKEISGKVIDITGKISGFLEVLGYAGKSKWFVKCKCGNISKVKANELKRTENREPIKSCYECSNKIKIENSHKEMISKIFGKLEVLDCIDKKNKYDSYYLCKCSCYNFASVRGFNLLEGKKTSCGCDKNHSTVCDKLIGNKIGKWSVICKSTNSKYNSAFMCQCECGNKRNINSSTLMSGTSIKCCCDNNIINMPVGSGRVLKAINSIDYEVMCGCGKIFVTRRGNILGYGNKKKITCCRECSNLNFANNKINQFIGKKVHDILVISRLNNNKTLVKYAKYFCKCLNCNNFCTIGYIQLKNNSKKSGFNCGCGRGNRIYCKEIYKTKDKKPVYDLSNKKYGELTVIKRYNNDSKNSTRYECLCDCGNIVVRSAKCLESYVDLSCGGFKGIGSYYWNTIVQGAKDREISLEISIDEAYYLLESQDFICPYTGIKLTLGDFHNKNFGKNASLDRIDSDKNYTLDNCEWIYKPLNVMKRTMSVTEFISLAKLVTNPVKEQSPEFMKIQNRLFKKLRSRAKYNEHEFSIDLDYLQSLFDNQLGLCSYTGKKLSLPESFTQLRKGFYTASLDRIDSSHGYIAGNIQWVLRDINRMKLNLNDSEYRNICKQINEYDRKL